MCKCKDDAPPVAQQGWRPIESAPRDGTAVWVWCDHAAYIGYFEPAEAPWDKAPGQWFLKAGFRRKRADQRQDEIYGTYAVDVAPTLWQPLPPAPSSVIPGKTEGGEG